MFEKKKEQIKVDREDFMLLIKKVADLEKASEIKKEIHSIIQEPTPPYIFECQVTYPIPPNSNPQSYALELQPKIDEFKKEVDELMRKYGIIRVIASYLVSKF